ncbi:hypothetical protein DBR00_12670 [Pseudomonas sp. HMWF032]|uniref:hypothetical protein n=1 Tax=unclassified Pseudomonas TaxID=196821 RepID=UPI000D3DC6C4|nr:MULTISPECIES: hypothetical protein [unclassified Pseudomonas]PTS83370.1 hypothetical protein DBR00_12670 [Pseudomonas sp. HMWF032]PTT82138.1 hypothetical protein DBR41_14675 [Pseudomonas sp. HMWF010]WAC45655.1 hypothetical protein OU997_05650 [Pseudomonas sp. SL4(2022)]
MHLLPLTHDLFDPQLQLEAEPLSADASPWPCLGVPSIHRDISQTIAAIDRLSKQLRQAPVHEPVQRR